jgi:MraZ protein
VFIGRHTNKIDKKGRISVPKPFRDALGDASASIFVFPSFKFPALEAAPRAFIEQFVANLNAAHDLFSDDQDDLASTVIENTHELAPDPEGRVILPKHFIDHAELGDEAIFVGRGTRFMIWSPKLYAPHNARAVERVRARGATLPMRSAETSTRGDGA